MLTAVAHLELLTPCFAGGARPHDEAELRATTIRGQLRWWFRVLGGFACLQPQPLFDQEHAVFGSAGRRPHRASPLVVRLRIQSAPRVGRQVLTLEQWQASLGPQAGYVLYPLQHRNRAAFSGTPLPRFDLVYSWRGDPALWASVQALVSTWAHLGSIGYRSRRGMGAVGFAEPAPALDSLAIHFGQPRQVLLKQMPAQNARHAIHILAQWLKKWRHYSRTPDASNLHKPAFEFTRQDHDAGLRLHAGEVYRPALGLPIFQRFRNGLAVRWAPGRQGRPDTDAHFASPVLLRPYRTAAGRWLALVIFVDAHRWPDGRRVYVNHQVHPVSRALYEAMKKDPALLDFS
jgi:hypothetical protein